MRVLITGARGFVGTRLSDRLKQLGFSPVCVDVEEMDVQELDAVSGTIRDQSPDAIVHLAGISFVPAAEADPALACRVNFGGARNLLDAVAQHAPQARILLIGSGEQYAASAPGDPPLDESAPLDPTTVYALTKTAADLAGAEAAHRGLDVIRVRPFNHTGAGQPDFFVAPEFARQVAEIELGQREQMEVGNLDSIRDILHVDDVVEAYVRLLNPDIAVGAYNVASGVGTRIGDLIEMLRERSTVEIRVTHDPAKTGRATNARVGDATKLSTATAWRWERSLSDTMEELLDHWRKSIRQDPAP